MRERSGPRSFEVTWIPARLSLRRLSVPLVHPLVPLCVCVSKRKSLKVMHQKRVLSLRAGSHLSAEQEAGLVRVLVEKTTAAAAEERRIQSVEQPPTVFPILQTCSLSTDTGKRFIVYPSPAACLAWPGVVWNCYVVFSCIILRPPRERECV